MTARTNAIGILTVLLAMSAGSASAQWIHYPAPGIPRTRSGKPNLFARAPHTSDGHPDFSGLWLASPDPNDPEQGTQGEALPQHFLDILPGVTHDEIGFTPWADALFKQRLADFLKDDPITRCLPLGVPRQDASADPLKIVQTRNLIVVLQEADASYRQIFLDGRPLPKDPQPSFMGNSAGRWQGDALVIESNGFRDQGWLDSYGHPHSDRMRLTERFRRRDFGHMEIAITIDDPKAYVKPLHYTQALQLIPDTELIESICAENERDFRHLVGKNGPQ